VKISDTLKQLDATIINLRHGQWLRLLEPRQRGSYQICNQQLVVSNSSIKRYCLCVWKIVQSWKTCKAFLVSAANNISFQLSHILFFDNFDC